MRGGVDNARAGDRTPLEHGDLSRDRVAGQIGSSPAAVRRRPDREQCGVHGPARFAAAGEGKRYSSSSEAAR